MIGPVFFYERSLNESRYYALIEEAISQLENDNIIWQQDGAPCHNTA